MSTCFVMREQFTAFLVLYFSRLLTVKNVKKRKSFLFNHEQTRRKENFNDMLHSRFTNKKKAENYFPRVKHKTVNYCLAK